MKLNKIVFVVSLLVVLIGCSTEQLPVNTKIGIAPGNKHFNIASTFEEGMFCFKEDGLYQDVPLLITVTDDDNAPVGRAEVGVYADFTENTYNGVGMLELYADHNANGVIDAPEELVTSSSSGIFKTKTDRYDGTAFLILRMYLTCPYEGDIFAYAGYSTFSMQVGVSFQSKQSTTEGETEGDTEGDTEGETEGDTEGDTAGETETEAADEFSNQATAGGFPHSVTSSSLITVGSASDNGLIVGFDATEMQLDGGIAGE